MIGGRWVIEFRNGSYYGGELTDNGVALTYAHRFPSKDAADRYMKRHQWILFNGGMAVMRETMF